MVDTELEIAKAQYETSIDKLAELDDDQLEYLTRLGELKDPLTDGLECDG